MRWRIHISRPFLAIAAFATLAGSAWWAFEKQHPSDRQMRGEFARHRDDFEKLVKMSDEDRHVVSIDFDSTALDSDGSWPRANVGISPDRWNSYRVLFRELRISHGLARFEDYPESVFFFASAIGIVPSGSAKGYAYSPKPLSPVRDSLDHFRVKESNEDTFTFEEIAPHWYLFLEDDR